MNSGSFTVSAISFAIPLSTTRVSVGEALPSVFSVATCFFSSSSTSCVAATASASSFSGAATGLRRLAPYAEPYVEVASVLVSSVYSVSVLPCAPNFCSCLCLMLLNIWSMGTTPPPRAPPLPPRPRALGGPPRRPRSPPPRPRPIEGSYESCWGADGFSITSAGADVVAVSGFST
eukprot:CAMPEP_0170468274 /NCGR_PEP_ID=MMETSP0123-20130129/11517_1 /TAXON_ID=182087 /ORGANISM="Favella ehrenbergii, Strain Fehren 1" /LENGTH=175 /DNA_ID=CAMNT_0010734805 /DNA_START=1573 /DNA_END=2096 /DNA_ORIENTATION=+